MSKPVFLDPDRRRWRRIRRTSDLVVVLLSVILVIFAVTVH